MIHRRLLHSVPVALLLLAGCTSTQRMTLPSSPAAADAAIRRADPKEPPTYYVRRHGTPGDTAPPRIQNAYLSRSLEEQFRSSRIVPGPSLRIPTQEFLASQSLRWEDVLGISVRGPARRGHALEGALAGGLIGFLTGYAIGASGDNDCDGTEGMCLDFSGIAKVSMGAVFGLVGLPIGAVAGSLSRSRRVTEWRRQAPD